nr:mitochondrial import receptor subunit TOM40-1-like [Ipomoea batatas]
MLDGDDFGNALYMIDIGQNDITNTFTNSSILHVLQQILTFIYEFKDAIEVAAGQVASTAIVALSYVQKVSEKVSLASDFMYNELSLQRCYSQLWL